MNELHQQIERKTNELVRKYSDEGFDVIVQPRLSQLPKFMREFKFQPDLIAKSPKETLVIEIATNASAEKLAQAAHYATIINEHPKWQFVLVMTNPRKLKQVPSEYQSMSVDQIHNALSNLRSLLEHSTENNSQFDDMAVLKAWSIVEAALRILVGDTKSVSPRSIVRDAVMNGTLSRRDGEFLDDVGQLRNRIVHGFTVNKIPKNIVRRLPDLIETILEEISEIGG